MPQSWLRENTTGGIIRNTKNSEKSTLVNTGSAKPRNNERKMNMEQIKAIQTEYNGYKFRSRLEARWAVFFDAAGIKYEYEPEGFENNGGKWLPDFYLPESKTYVEVKPDRDNAVEELKKPFAFVIAGIVQRLLILPNIPEDAEIAIWWFTFAYYHPGIDGMRIAKGAFSIRNEKIVLATDLYIGYVGEKTFYGFNSYFERILNCFLLKPINDLEMPYNSEGKLNEPIKNDDPFTFSDTCIQNELDHIRKCYNKARQARFEHGEKG
jgi:hypothetical protein